MVLFYIQTNKLKFLPQPNRQDLPMVRAQISMSLRCTDSYHTITSLGSFIFVKWENNIKLYKELHPTIPTVKRPQCNPKGCYHRSWLASVTDKNKQILHKVFSRCPLTFSPCCHVIIFKGYRLQNKTNQLACHLVFHMFFLLISYRATKIILCLMKYVTIPNVKHHI